MDYIRSDKVQTLEKAASFSFNGVNLTEINLIGSKFSA